MRSESSKPHAKKAKSRRIKVGYLARVEGEGSLDIKLRDGKVQSLKFKIFEPPRFFEAFLRGRKFDEAPDITARICGICPVAYQMSAVHAIEDAFGVKVDGQLRALRRLIYCGEWIESHALHVALLHAPDFLGYEDAIQMAKDHPEIVTKALQLKKTGNDIVALLGGREIHPINVRVGGFYRLPNPKELRPLAEKLNWARHAAREMVLWTAKFKFPDFERDYEFVALRHPGEYPFNEGRLVSNKGLDIAINEYDSHFVAEHIEHTNALVSSLKGRGAYFVGPLARFNLNFDKLSPTCRALCAEAGLEQNCRNPFKSIIVRAIETFHACEEALRLIEAYEPPEKPTVDIQPRAGVGYGCSEAPRGILYHRYKISEEGLILDAKISPPTAQNQKTIEGDLWEFVRKHMSLSDEKLGWQCEQAIRNYDPCISCSVHFLRLKVDRG
ncbi:MAG: Ni/Fe hydrogenase subunit alpha [bacterium]